MFATFHARSGEDAKARVKIPGEGPLSFCEDNPAATRRGETGKGFPDQSLHQYKLELLVQDLMKVIE
jgi:hypothetical protein